MKRKQTMKMRSPDRIKADNELADKAVVCKSTAPSEKEICTKSEYAFRASVGYATAAAEEISGDTAISCGLPDGSLALILSDGMGKGIRAAADSRTVVRHLRKNLKSGIQPAKAIKELNRYMIEHQTCTAVQEQTDPGERQVKKEANRLRGYAHRELRISNKSSELALMTAELETEAEAEAERFATVDLLLIDRNCGKARFYKMGAATSFLIRNAKVREFEKAALPVGMLDGIRLRQLTAELRDGDVIVMVSDGITEADRSDLFGSWLPRLLHDIFADAAMTERTEDSSGVRKLAGFILDEALKHYGSRERDDLTVAVVKIAAEQKLL